MTKPTNLRSTRIESIDLLRGTIMIIMALDHVRDYFHRDAYLYDPTDLTQTSIFLFFTRWITHFCAPLFMFLAGVSAYLYGQKKGRAALSFFLLTRGVWLVVAELLLVTLGWTFNLHYPVLIFQVIWAFGISMIVLSLLNRLPLRWALLTGIILIAGHNLLDTVHVTGKGMSPLFWSMLHERQVFTYGSQTLMIGYPVLPWIGLILVGYCAGSLYAPSYDPAKRKKTLIALGATSSLLFIFLRLLNGYGDPSHWSVQRNGVYTVLSFLNVSKYPPSLLYILMTLGPGLLFLAFSEKPLNALTSRLVIVGRVPMFFYLAHIYLIHGLACAGALLCGYPASDMIISTWVSSAPALRGYGFSLPVVYGIWIGIVLLLFPLCKSYDVYKRANQATKPWLSYL